MVQKREEVIKSKGVIEVEESIEEHEVKEVLFHKDVWYLETANACIMKF